MELLKETEYGEIWDMSVDEYHATDPWSHSQLKLMNRSPMHMRYGCYEALYACAVGTIDLDTDLEILNTHFTTYQGLPPRTSAQL